MIKFIIEGKPFGKQRPRFRRTGKFVSTYTPKETVAYEEKVKKSFLKANKSNGEYEGCVSVTINAYFKPPKSTSKKKYNELIGKPYLKKSDCDNIAKIICDPLNKIAYKDDCQVYNLVVNKCYSEKEYVEVIIKYEEEKEEK